MLAIGKLILNWNAGQCSALHSAGKLRKRLLPSSTGLANHVITTYVTGEEDGAVMDVQAVIISSTLQWGPGIGRHCVRFQGKPAQSSCHSAYRQILQVRPRRTAARKILDIIHGFSFGRLDALLS